LQAETINRLLKKQSTRQAKNKRLAATITATASASHTHTHTAAATPAPAASDAEDGDGEREGEGEGNAEEDDNEKKKEPEMYRWVSNAAGLSFSVPVGVLPSSEAKGMVVDSSTSVPTTRKASKSIPAQLPKCDVRNCKAVRKYRLVSDWEKGACGMAHLKVLQGRARG
jgi:Ino eighty subunit 2